MKKFTKLSDDGERLPDDATEWAAVLDNTTGLMWSRQSIGNSTSEDDDGDSDAEMDFAEAESSCAALDLAGFTDWRLPTVDELFALADRTRFNPAIDTDYFECASDWYWSASAAAWSPESYAWIVDFSGGLVLSVHRGGHAFVRAVRCARVPAGQ